MNKMLTKAANTLYKEIGQNKIMALATRKGDGVAVRTVNIYTYQGCFFFVTEANSNKYLQILQNGHIAMSADAIQITGRAVPLEHPCEESNREIACFVEEVIPHQFQRFADNPIMRLIKVTPSFSSFILLDSGQGFIIDFLEETAVPVQRER